MRFGIRLSCFRPWMALPVLVGMLAAPAPARGEESSVEPSAPATGDESAARPSTPAEAGRSVADPPPVELPPPCGPGVRGCYLARDGRYRSVDATYATSLVPPKAHYLIAAVEDLTFVAIGAVWYMVALDDNKVDWDIESVRQRFSRESVRFDSNTFTMNFLLHPLSGSAYYAFPRANGLNVGVSATYAFLSSMLWEFGLEFNEKLSINDVIATPLGGMGLGEFFFRLGKYLNSAPGGGDTWHRVLGCSLGVVQCAHDRAADHRRGSAPGTVVDSLGFDAAIAHAFAIRSLFGAARVDEGSSFFRYEVSVDADLVAMPGYLRPGAFGRFYADGNFTRFRVRGLGGPSGNGTFLDSDAVLFGYYAQDVRGEGRPRGWGLSVGSSVGYTYRRDDHEDFHDRWCLTHFPGLALDLTVLRPRLAMHTRLRGYGDFAGVHSMAFDAWRDANPGVITKPVLEREGYYYAWGGSLRFDLDFEMPWVLVGGSVFAGKYRSQDGLDRHQEEIDAMGVDVHASDGILELEAHLRLYPFRRLPISVEIGGARYLRSSRAGGYTAHASFDRLGAGLGVRF